MPPTFNPCLINDASGDPGLLVPFSFENRAIAFDLGDIHHLASREILKISHVFISHTHMDHFAGFDRLLRIVLGREKILHFFGPSGFLKNIQGKLSGYTWNLVDNFSNQLILFATETDGNALRTQEYACKNRFQPTGAPMVHQATDRIIHEESGLQVKTIELDHGIPSLGFALRERFRINIRKDVLDEMGLTPGPWLHRLKQAVYDDQRSLPLSNVILDEKVITILKNITFNDLIERLTIISAGQKIGYIADAAYTPANVEKIVDLVRQADQLFIESAFLEKDADHASAKRHLTARQAGEIAGMAGVKRFTLFHFSPRYQNAEMEFYREAMGAYEKNC